MAADLSFAVAGYCYGERIGERVEVTVAAGLVRLRHGTQEVAVHKLAEGRRQRILDPVHLAGVAGTGGRAVPVPAGTAAPPAPPSVLARPLAEYEALAGGAF